MVFYELQQVHMIFIKTTVFIKFLIYEIILIKIFIDHEDQSMFSEI